MGSFVPARRARIGVVDRVLTRVGASDNLSRGESTFMVEMKETANVLRRATRRSLVILDEIGRGTSTYDGLAIAWAVAEHLHDVVGCRAMFATHYHELTELAATRRAAARTGACSAREHAGRRRLPAQAAARARRRGATASRARASPGCPSRCSRARKAILDGARARGGAASGARARSARPRGAAARPLRRPRRAGAHPALETLRAVDVDRLTPLEALQLVATLKKQL